MCSKEVSQVTDDLSSPFVFNENIRLAIKEQPQNIPIISAKEQYAATAVVQRQVSAVMDRAATDAFNDYVRRVPAAANLKVRPSNLAYKPNPDKYKVVIPGIMDRLLKPDWATKTQIAIADSVTTDTGVNVNKNVWRSPLPAKALTRFKDRLSVSMIRHLEVNLTGCKTLADIKASMKAAIVAAESDQTVTVKLQLTPTHLVIGRASYPLTIRNGKNAYRTRIDGKQRWIDVDALQYLISKSTAKA
ncbi:MAG: hypothetical protein KBT56_04635 [Paraperlucidibaca sp.]|nr:hypothetical protein [Paraperlucidibaca sp.]